MITDEEIELNAYLGTDFAQSVIAEIGQDAVEAIWRAGYLARSEADLQRLLESQRFGSKEGE